MKEDGKLYVPESQALIDPITEYLKGLGGDDCKGVLFTFDTHSEDTYPGSPESEAFPIHCVKGTAGHRLAFPAASVPFPISIFTLEKNVFNMWEEDDIRIIDEDGYRSDRDFFFNHLIAQDVTDIEVVGVAADFCVKWAVDGLVERGFKVRVMEGLTKGIERQIDQVLKEDWANKRVSLG